MKSKDAASAATSRRAEELGLDQFIAAADGGLELDADSAGGSLVVSESADASSLEGAEISFPHGEEPASSPRITPIQILEAMLFVDEGPLYPDDVAAMIPGITVGDVEAMIASLAEAYHREGRPYELVASGGGHHLRLREGFHRIVDRLYNRGRTHRLSPAAVDVLALVAYRQPLGRSAIESQRGANCGALLRQLVQRGVLGVRRADGSREVVYETTPLFLKLFGLNGLDELPRAEDLEKL